ncbi:MAG: alpha/beta hydrolase-fold protein [Bacteroidota bacterium]
MNRILKSLILITTTSRLYGQLLISGTVVDQNTGAPLSFVNIGIKNKNTGVTSALSGAFDLNIPATLQNDSLTFSMVGYQPLTIHIPFIAATHHTVFKLKAKFIPLQNVVVTAKKLHEKKYGIVRYNPLLHFIDASENSNDIFEIAQLVHLDKDFSKITSVNLFINESMKDSVTFRINFYSLNNGLPGERILEKSIVQTHEIKEGWLRFDLRSQDVYLKQDVVVGIEFMPAKNRPPVKYELKLGGRTKSYSRGSSLGSWNRPPHHYRLFVTALSDDDELKKTDDEEDETLATKKIYSAHVKDSFSIFVNLPKNYKRHSDKKYRVIYLLDANVFFEAVAEFLSAADGSNEAILVGIGYRNAFEADSLRHRDYTYPKALAADSMALSSGATQFIDFIKKELVPYIDKKYKSHPHQRTIMGHSLGGYFSLYFLKTELKSKKPLFDCFVAASPSVDYAGRYLFSEFTSPAETNFPLTLYITSGEREDLKGFNSFLRVLKGQHLQLKTDIFLQMDHMEAALPGFKKGLNLCGDH